MGLLYIGLLILSYFDISPSKLGICPLVPPIIKLPQISPCSQLLSKILAYPSGYTLSLPPSLQETQNIHPPNRSFSNWDPKNSITQTPCTHTRPLSPPQTQHLTTEANSSLSLSLSLSLCLKNIQIQKSLQPKSL